MNIDRDLEFGRAYNTFGEDPFLTSEMGVAEVKGIQSQHVMAQIKHYVGYDSDGTNTFIDDQTLHEVYVAPFDAAVQRADVSSIMCSYNRAQRHLRLRQQRPRSPRSCATKSASRASSPPTGARCTRVDFINAGLDMEMPGEPGPGGFPIPSFFDSLPFHPRRH